MADLVLLLHSLSNNLHCKIPDSMPSLCRRPNKAKRKE